jgi:hypothetical protein
MRPVVCGNRRYAASPILHAQRGDEDVQLAQAREVALQEDREWYQQYIAPDAASGASQQPQQPVEQPTRRQRQQRDFEEIDAGVPWQPPAVSEDRRTGVRMRLQADDAVQLLAEVAVAAPAAAAVELTEQDLQQLRALGYADAEAQTLTEDMRGLVLERKVGQLSADSHRGHAWPCTGAQGRAAKLFANVLS